MKRTFYNSMTRITAAVLAMFLLMSMPISYAEAGDSATTVVKSRVVLPAPPGSPTALPAPFLVDGGAFDFVYMEVTTEPGRVLFPASVMMVDSTTYKAFTMPANCHKATDAGVPIVVCMAVGDMASFRAQIGEDMKNGLIQQTAGKPGYATNVRVLAVQDRYVL